MSHAHAFNILVQITTDTKRPSDISDVLWARLGSTIKWIYGTISSDLLQTILLLWGFHISFLGQIEGYFSR